MVKWKNTFQIKKVDFMNRMIYNILIAYTICMFTVLTSGMLYRLTVRPDRLVCEQEGQEVKWITNRLCLLMKDF